MTEEQMKKYVVNGGKLFTITLIDTIRDGGTKIIKTTKDAFNFKTPFKLVYAIILTGELTFLTKYLWVTLIVLPNSTEQSTLAQSSFHFIYRVTLDYSELMMSHLPTRPQLLLRHKYIRQCIHFILLS